MKLPMPMQMTSTTSSHSNSAWSERRERRSCQAPISPAMTKAPLDIAFSGSAQKLGSPPRSQ